MFASQGQEAFIEGHLEAFRVLGGTPIDKIRYGNLKSAVTRVLFGRNRTESDRWVAFRSHYGFDTFYCLPGIEGAHEKGGVEGEVGRSRRNHLVPMPEVATLVELNAHLEQIDAAEDRRRIGNRTLTVGYDFALQQSLLRPLPAEGIDPGLTLTPRVDRYARVMVRMAHYSVPACLIGRRVKVSLRASELVVFDGRTEVARHARSVRKGSQSLLLDHYLEVLARKPGRCPARPRWRRPAEPGRSRPRTTRSGLRRVRRTGDAGSTRAIVEVLLLHRHLAHGNVVAGLAAAVAVGSASPDAVAVEARKAARLRGASPTVGAPGAAAIFATAPVAPTRRDRVASLTERRLVEARGRAGGLPADGRPLPSVTQYDELPAHPPATTVRSAGTRGA